jgi:prevent-host-death family protein
MKEYRSDEARRAFREILNEVEHQGEHVTVLRYQTPAAVVVPVEWYDAVTALVADLEAYEAWRNRAVALRRGRRAAGLPAQDPRVVHHIDGDPANNDLENLRIVDPRENGTTQ